MIFIKILLVFCNWQLKKSFSRLEKHEKIIIIGVTILNPINADKLAQVDYRTCRFSYLLSSNIEYWRWITAYTQTRQLCALIENARVKWTIECKINFISYANVVREYTDCVYL